MERVALCRYVVVKPSDVAGDLVGGLAQRLLQVQALPEMQELEWDAVSLAVQLRLEGEQAMKPIRQGLGAAGKAAQLKGHAEARLLVIVGPVRGTVHAWRDQRSKPGGVCHGAGKAVQKRGGLGGLRDAQRFYAQAGEHAPPDVSGARRGEIPSQCAGSTRVWRDRAPPGQDGRVAV